ncbi:MAG: transglutaminase-like domain-containing protein [Myxococcota bacterium]
MKQDQLLTTALQIVSGCRTERERAVAIHDFVRDRVRFGFTRHFDLASPDQTLTAGLGHCNPQAQLFVALLGAVDISARLHFVTIDNRILDGCFPPGRGPGDRLSHAFSEVRLGGRWVRTDSYIADPQLAAAARPRLRAAGKTMGHGVHVHGTGQWDGRSDAFSQFADPAMALADHGTFSSVAEFAATRHYRHRIGPIKMTTALRWLPGWLTRPLITRINRRIDQLRSDDANAQGISRVDRAVEAGANEMQPAI